MARRPFLGKSFGFFLMLSVVGLSQASAQEGVVLSGVGAINRSMGGTAVAAPLDASGALHWNPASITGLESSEMEFGVELLFPHGKLSSSVAPSSFGPGIPPIGLAGSTDSDSGVFPLPTFGLVYKPDDPDWTFGLGVFTVGGFGVNYPASTTNPILTPQPPAGFGVGSLYSQLEVLQIAPTAAYKLTDRLSIGFAPTLSLADLRIDPAVIAPPDDANGDGFPSYPRGTHTRIAWGGGFQAGLYYTLENGWAFGTSVKSKQWFETFHWNATDELGRPRTLDFNLEYPTIVSVGTAYTGFERWVLATDLRYIDYKNAAGFRESGFGPTGALNGVGWKSIFVASAGVQYQWTDAISLRGGYSYNQNPIENSQSSTNIASPTITQHALYAGASYNVSEALLLSAAYAHAFENSISGPLVSAFGPVPGTSVTNTISADTFIIGATIRFGCKDRSRAAADPGPNWSE